MKSLSFALSVLALAAVPALAAEAPVPTEAAAVSPVKERLVCKRVERVGTRLGGKKTCLTESAWKDIAQNAGDTTKKMQEIRTPMIN